MVKLKRIPSFLSDIFCDFLDCENEFRNSF
jgi:hypothetical protein